MLRSNRWRLSFVSEFPVFGPVVCQRNWTGLFGANGTISAMAYWYRRVFLLAIPLILSNLTQPLLSTVDTVLSGHLPGAAALGGVAVGGIFFNSVFWTFGFLRMTTTGLVAQAYGA
jgi:multidrug resistance protein, MATE family